MTLQKTMNKFLGCLVAALMLGVPGASAFAADPATDAGTAKDTTTTATKNVAQVTDKNGYTASYTSVKDAFAAAPAGATITLLADSDLAAYTSTSTENNGTSLSLEVTKPVTLDGDGHTLTVHGQGIYLMGSATEGSSNAFSMGHVTIVNPDESGTVMSARSGAMSFVFNNVALQTTGTGTTQAFTVESDATTTTPVTFTASTVLASQGGYGIVASSPVDLALSDTMVSGYGAIYLKSTGSSAGASASTVDIVNGSVVSSTGIAGANDSFGTIALSGVKDVQVNVENSTVTANASSEQPATKQSVIDFLGTSAGTDAAAENNTVTFNEGSKANAFGTQSAFIDSNGEKNSVLVKDGQYDLQGTVFAAQAADDPTIEDAAGTDLVVTGGTWTRNVSAYVPEGYTGSQMEDGKMTVTASSAADDPDNTTKPTQPTQPAGSSTGNGAMSVATPSGSQTADQAMSQTGASLQQTGDTFLEGMVSSLIALAVVAGGALIYRHREA